MNDEKKDHPLREVIDAYVKALKEGKKIYFNAPRMAGKSYFNKILNDLYKKGE